VIFPAFTGSPVIGFPSYLTFAGRLDAYKASCAAVYSTTRLLSSYTGPLLNVKRSTDGATSDIGYQASGFIDTAALAAFAQGGTLTIQKMYDQSGKSPNALVAAAAPGITTAGVTVYSGGQNLSVSNVGSSIPTNAADVTFIVKTAAQADSIIYIAQGVDDGNYQHARGSSSRYGGRFDINYPQGDFIESFSWTQGVKEQCAILIYTNGTIQGWLDGQAGVVHNQIFGIVNAPLYIGSWVAQVLFWQGSISSVVALSTALTAAQVAQITAAMP
jgi:hypothetical protein